jgi:hypothetical protein
LSIGVAWNRRFRDEILSRIRQIEVVFGEQLESYRPSAELAGLIWRLTEKNLLLLRNYIQYGETGRECIASGVGRLKVANRWPRTKKQAAMTDICCKRRGATDRVNGIVREM